jgi:MFS family permease
LMVLVAVLAGLGGALTAPAVSAFYLDITEEQHRSRVLGIKESSLALGGVTGPLLVAGISAVTTPQGVFSIAGALIVIGVVLAFTFLREPRRAAEGIASADVAWAVSGQRAIAAQAALRCVVLRARAAREVHDAA